MDLGSAPCNKREHAAAKIRHECVNEIAHYSTAKARSAAYFATNRGICTGGRV